MAKSRKRVERNAVTGPTISAERIHRGIAVLERDWAREFKARVDRERRVHGLQTKFNAPLLELLARDRRSTAALAELRRMERPPASESKRGTPRPMSLQVGRFQSALSMLIGPPYDHSYRWEPTEPPYQHVQTNPTLGKMKFRLETTAAPTPSWFMCRGALGMSYWPAKTGLLQVMADPVYVASTSASSGGMGGAAHAETWMDMWIDRYHPNGTFDARIVDQATLLQSFDGWSGSGAGQTLTVPSGPPPPPAFAGHLAGVATVIGVDAGFGYVIWIWCGGYVAGMGRTQTWTDFAVASMDVTIPSLRIDQF